MEGNSKEHGEGNAANIVLKTDWGENWYLAMTGHWMKLGYTGCNGLRIANQSNAKNMKGEKKELPCQD